MGRRESPVDPGAGPVQRFAHELRKLREEAGGLTYRDMAKRAGYSVTTLSQAAAGDRLASLPVILAYVEACGANQAEWESRWREISREAALATVEDSGANGPYLGLAAYETTDHSRFFGRDRLVGELLELVGRRRFAAVFGPSGSGKSSLLRAGLVPAAQAKISALDGHPGVIRVFTPGEHPIRRNATQFKPPDDGLDLLMVVDQFEEVFTLCRDPGERAEFIDLLLAARHPESRIRVVVAVRADFYGRCAEHRELAESLRDANLLVGPMNREELREAIVQPALAAGLIVERALTARLVEEAADEVGGLPLMSHALRETWRRRQGKMLTLDGYEAAGGVHGAIAHTAEQVYTRLSPAQAEVARRILLRLVNPGEQAQDTRRPADRAELDLDGSADVALVLEHLARARLLILHEDVVEIAHEALLVSWPRLRDWIEEDRERLRVQRGLTEAATIWEGHDRDPGALYRGMRLAAAERLLTESDQRAGLNQLEHDFLTAGVALARRGSRVRTVIMATLVVLLVISTAAGGTATWQTRIADKRLDEAMAQLVAGRAEALRATDPKTARQLSAAAWTIAQVPEARNALITSMADPAADIFTDPQAAAGSVHALSQDGSRLAAYTPGKTGQAGTLRVYDVAAHKQVVAAPWAASEKVYALAWAPDGKTVAAAGEGGMRLWDTTGGQPRSPAFGPGVTTADSTLRFSPSGRLLIIGNTKAAGIWDVRRRKRVLAKPVSVISPDDRLGLVAPRRLPVGVATTYGASRRPQPLLDGRPIFWPRKGQDVELWDLRRRERIPAPWLPKSAVDAEFSPDGRLLVISTSDSGIRLFDVSAKREIIEPMSPASKQVAFSPDSAFLAGTDDMGNARLWRVRDGTLLAEFRFPATRATTPMDPFSADNRLLLFSSDNRLLRILEAFGSVHTYDVSVDTKPLLLTPGGIDRSFSPDGRFLIVTDGGRHGREVTLWDVVNRKRLGRPLVADNPPKRGEDEGENGPFYSTAFSPDGRLLALTHPGRSVVSLWDVATQTRIGSFHVRQEATGIKSMAFSPDGKTIAVSPFPLEGVEDLELWDVGTRKWIKTVSGAGGKILAFDLEGRHLFVGSGFEGILVDPIAGKVLDSEPDVLAQGEVAFIQGAAVTGDVSGRLTFWKPGLRETLAPPQSVGKGQIIALVPFPSGGLIAAVGDGAATVSLWDVRKYREAGPSISDYSVAAPAVAFSRTALLISSSDGILREIIVDPGRASAVICDRDGHLSQSDWRTYIPELPYRDTCA